MEHAHRYKLYKFKPYSQSCIEQIHDHEVYKIKLYIEYTYSYKECKMDLYIEYTHSYEVYEIELYIE